VRVGVCVCMFGCVFLWLLVCVHVGFTVCMWVCVRVGVCACMYVNCSFFIIFVNSYVKII